MTPLEIYQAYARERRTLPIDGLQLEALAGLSRYTALDVSQGADGIVQFADLEEQCVGAQIDEQTRYFDQVGQDFEWKVYDFDQPPSLRSQLAARGFACEEEEAFLALPLKGWSPLRLPPVDVELVKIVDEAKLGDVMLVQRAVWKEHHDWLHGTLASSLRKSPGEISIYCAYVGGEPVGTGWINFPPGCAFADLHGGSVVPGQRGRGIFSALVDARLAEAQHRSCAFVAVDTTRMSRPILLKLGFQHVCYTYPLRRRRGP